VAAKLKGGISMGFTESVRTVLTKKYVTFSGRASRSEYWWFQLLYAVVLTVLAALFFIVVEAEAGPDESGSTSVILLAILALFFLATFLPQAALHVRRFHDLDISGWLYLAAIILSLVPYIGRAVGIGILVVSSRKGTAGPNKYGPDPLRPEAIAEVFA
jgi:uncharacterized membrane protein YhaH (DUF805 family)